MSQSITSPNSASGNSIADETSPPREAGAGHWLRSSLPTAAVMAALALLAVWGHSNEWTFPKFSALFGGGEQQEDDWCLEHNVPASQCIECKPELLPRSHDHGWCKEHGIAPCPLHHPEVAQLKDTPEISREDRERAARALSLRPRHENNSLCMLHERRIQFASIAAMDKAGVDIAIVTQRPVIESIATNGEVIYDQTRSAHLASRVAGTVWRVEKHLGDRVEEGDVLALIDAADIGRAKAELLTAIAQVRSRQATLERLQSLATDQAVAARQVREAEAALQEAEIRLLGAGQSLTNLGLPVKVEEFDGVTTAKIAERIRFLGLPQDVISGLDEQTTTSNLFPLRAPLAGVVVESDVVAGEVVDTTHTLFGVADVRQMWLVLHVRQDEAKYLVLGQKVLFRSGHSSDDPEVAGTLAWISTEADHRMHTIKIRIHLPNEDRRLRGNTFGTGRIVLREEPKAMVVPSEAVHSDGDCSVVFVRDKHFLSPDSPKFFHVRKVRVGAREGNFTEIIAGLLPGEVIASKNSVVLQAQLLKGNLGEGCGCAH